jgi:hypothetical protein
MAYSDPEQQKKFQREWVARRRADYLSGKSCEQCGSTKQLEVDHIDPSLKVSHRIWSWSAKRREEELSKTQVLCGRCHKAKTARDRFAQVKHGNVWMYQRYKCRCDLCRAAKSAELAAFRARKAARLGTQVRPRRDPVVTDETPMLPPAPRPDLTPEEKANKERALRWLRGDPAPAPQP